MQFVLREDAKADALEIDVLDVIGKGFLFRGVTAEAVLASLRASKAKRVMVRVNSVGGFVGEATAIKQLLRERSASGSKVTINVIGLAASSATIITDAGDEVTIAKGAFFMIHEAMADIDGRGTMQDHQKAIDAIGRANATMVDMYVAASKRRSKNKSADDFMVAMKDERFFSAAEAVDWGLADKVTDDVRVAACADVSKYENAPTELLDAYSSVMASLQTPDPFRENTPPPAPAGSADTATEPSKEVPTMADKPAETMNVITIARALELTAGATEQDAIAASVRLRQLEVGVQAMTGVKNSAECLGALRGIMEKADKYDAMAAELAQVKAERDLQNFESLINQGRAEKKLNTEPQVALYREQFDAAAKEGRGADVVAHLRGWLKATPPDVRFIAKSQPAANAGSGSPLVWKEKTYAQLRPAQRAALAKEDPDLFRLMKDDFNAAGAAA